MIKLDLPYFERFMQELAEVYDRKPYTTAALEHWGEALKNVPWERVLRALTRWRDSKPRAPVISEFLQLLNELETAQRERDVVVEKKASVAPAPVSEYGRECLAQIKTLTARKVTHGVVRQPGEDDE